jgi:hypothetical protein
MVLAPWTIISPVGDDSEVEDSAQLKVVAKANGLIDKKYTNELKGLVGDGNSTPLDKLPRHRRGWQLLQRVQWLMHVETGEMVPVIGGDGTRFVTNFAGWCSFNLLGLSGERLNTFLNAGWYWSNGFKEYRLRSSWALAAKPPEHALAHLRAFVHQQQQIASGAAAAPIKLPNYAEAAHVPSSSSRAAGSHEVRIREPNI